MAGKADKKCNMVDLTYFKKALTLMAHRLPTEDLTVFVSINYGFPTNEPNLLSTLGSILFLSRANAFIYRFPNHHTHRRFGKFGLGKAILSLYCQNAFRPFLMSPVFL